jgi:hypothetical protein
MLNPIQGKDFGVQSGLYRLFQENLQEKALDVVSL